MAPAHADRPEIEVSPDGSRASQPVAPTNFTGEAHSKPLFDATDYSDMSGGQVSFEPGARTAWHSHPAGQTLIITEGVGWVQSWGGPKQQMTPGDVVRIPPGVKHWHGAKAGDDMTHIAIAEAVDGVRVTWMEQVTEAQYLS
ncbi:cupin domain-containing protein [Mycolicibacterium goodii]|uniref:(R)-mandelonitrile lyase n=1 Tax=Mycolicibacterium goodii TaxID=134601 RepID=UPI00296E90DF